VGLIDKLIEFCYWKIFYFFITLLSIFKNGEIIIKEKTVGCRLSDIFCLGYTDICR
jgi:hypothetical protein